MADGFEKHLFSYNHDGARWSFTVPATSAEDAQERISKMQFANYDGILHKELRLPSGAFANLICWWMNRRARAARQD